MKFRDRRNAADEGRSLPPSSGVGLSPKTGKLPTFTTDELALAVQVVAVMADPDKVVGRSSDAVRALIWKCRDASRRHAGFSIVRSDDA